MSKLKKAVSLAVIAVMMMSLFLPVSAFQVSEDVKGTEYESTAAILGALNIMVGDYGTGDFRPGDDILRSEVATVAVRTLGLDSLAAGFASQKTFQDVVDGHWANGYINVAASQKLVVGDDGVNFRPDDQITVQEAAVIFTKMLGYENRAVSNGGFPTGYMITASSIGLFEGIKNLEGNATRGLIATMAENALEIKMMEQTGYGSVPTFEVGEKTILKDTLNVTKEYGQITANMFTRLNGANSSLKDNQVEINDSIYNDLTGTATSLLGYQVMYLYKENKSSGENEILLALPDQKAMSEITVDGENIVAITGEGARKVEYWENKDTDKKTQIANISENAVMIYNGVVTAFDATLAKPVDGSVNGMVQLIDSNRDDIYEIVNVTNYENMVVDEISTVSYKVFDKYDQDPIALDPNDKTVKFTLTKSGANFNFADLKEWDVLSVAKSLDGKALHVMVSSESVEGKVTELSKNYVYVDGKKYKVASNYTKNIALDDEGVFYLDHFGKIAAVDNKTRYADQYAYLYDAYSTTSGRNAKFSLLTAKGERIELDGAEKMTLNSKSGLKPSEVLAKVVDAQGDALQQVVTYETNEKGELKVLSLAEDLTDGTINDKVFGKNAELNDAEYRANVNKLGKYNVAESTVIFDIPASAKDDTSYAVRDRSMLVDKNQYDAVLYDVEDDLTAKVIVITNSDGVISGETSLAVVDSIAQTQNADKVTVEKLYAYQDGKLIEKNATDDSFFVDNEGKALRQGDIIRFTTNAKDEIDEFEILFRAEEKETEAIKELDKDTSTVYGKVMRKFANSINVSVNGADTANYAIDKAVVYEYDSEKVENQITVVTAADIQKYDEAEPRRVFMKVYKNQVTEIVIVR